MSRFVNLELGDESGERGQEKPPGLVQDESAHLAAAHAEFENGNFEAALRQYARALEFNSRSAAAWTGQVRMLIELGEFREASLWANKALEYFPNEPELLAAKAVSLGRSGDLQEALAFSDAAITERGDSPYLWLARGDVLLCRRESRAHFCIDKALEFAPKDWFIAWLAARIRFYHEQFALALKLIQQALEWNTGHFVLWLELGRCQQALGLTGPATQSFNRARELNPQCRDARSGLVTVARTGTWLRMRGLFRQLFHR